MQNGSECIKNILFRFEHFALPMLLQWGEGLSDIQRAIHPLMLTAANDPDEFVRRQAEYALRQLNSA